MRLRRAVAARLVCTRCDQATTVADVNAAPATCPHCRSPLWRVGKNPSERFPYALTHNDCALLVRHTHLLQRLRDET